MKKARVASAFIVAVGITAAVSSLSKGGARLVETKLSEPTPNSKVSVAQGYAKLPLSFEPNRGQAKDRAAFLAHGTGYTISLRPTEALLSLGKRDTLRMRITGASKRALLVPEHRLQGKVNYLLGNDRSRWLTGIPTYARLTADDVYPGIDLAYFGRQGRLEYDFLVRPGASPETISLAFAGARSLRLERNGNLRLQFPGGSLRQLAPRIYQQVGGERRRVQGRFVLDGRSLGFAVGDYDKTRTLVIDPTLVYSTYLGGNGDEVGTKIVADSAGNTYVTGITASSDFPTAGPYQPANAGIGDVFVTKLNASASALLYSTYLGGAEADWPNGLAVDLAGNAYLAGYTYSTDFPTVNPYQATYGGSQDGFVTKLNPSGNALVYSTYLGGSDRDNVFGGVAVDSAGSAHVAGFTLSTNFPTASPYQPNNAGFFDAFVTKLSPSGNTLSYSTYLGGGSFDDIRAIDLGPAGDVYVAGTTYSSNFPTASPYQATDAGLPDAFVTRLNPGGTGLTYSTFLGGNTVDQALAIAVVPAGDIYLAGLTYSTDFPTANPFQATYGGGQDGFVTKLNPSGSALLYSTYLGGSTQDEVWGIAVDSVGSAYLAGFTISLNFPTSDAIQGANAGSTDGFVTKLTPSGGALNYSTYLGGSADDYATGIAVGSDGSAYIEGQTRSTNFPTATPYQAASAGQADAFVSKFTSPVENACGSSPNSPCVVEVRPRSMTLSEPVGPDNCVGLTINILQGKVSDGNVQIRWKTVSGTAKAPQDYDNAGAAVTIPSGTNTANITVCINDDNVTEPRESFSIQLFSPVSASIEPAGQKTTIFISSNTN